MHLVIQYVCVCMCISVSNYCPILLEFFLTPLTRPHRPCGAASDQQLPPLGLFFPIATTYQKAFQVMGIHRKVCCHVFQQSTNRCMNTSELISISHQHSEGIQLYRYCQILKLLIKK